jgi:adhesin HecA-like repeat protein
MNTQSMLSPAGPDGELLLELAWLLFGGGMVIFLAVAGFLAVASFGGARARATLGSRRFILAGCGGCHAVRGTPWQARIGQDLTHVGGRLSLAAGTLDNHRGTLAGWIAGSQDLKPGNRMPSFAAALDGPELRALAAWQESLK